MDTTTSDADLPTLPPGDIRFDGRHIYVGDDPTPLAPGRYRLHGSGITTAVLEVVDDPESDEETAQRYADEE